MKNILISFLLLSTGTLVFAQIPRDVANVQSPNVASLGAINEVQVSQFTGTPSINVPIYTFSEGDIQIPIILSCNTSGFKPDIRAGWVGQNMSLQSGGMIYRTVKFEPDDKKSAPSGYFDRNVSLYLNGDDWATKLVMVFDANNLIDEPDDFSFEAPGISGKFYMGSDGKFRVLSEQDLKVQFFSLYNSTLPQFWTMSKPPFCSPQIGSTWSNSYLEHLSGFKITDEKGTQYIFGSETAGNTQAVDYDIDFFSQGKSTWIANAWHLTKIIDRNGKQVTLTYERKELNAQMYVSVSNRNKSVRWNGNTGFFSVYNSCSSWSFNNTPPWGIYQGKLISPVYLKEINGLNTKVVFENSISTQLKYDSDVFTNFYNYALSNQLNNGLNDAYTLFPFLHTCVYDSENQPSFIPCTGGTCTELPVENLFEKMKWRKLDKIKIYDKVTNTQKKRFDFTYNNIVTERLFLTTFQEVPLDNSVTTKPYIFEYFSDPNGLIIMPKYVKSHTDHWGFNNGKQINPFNFEDPTNYTNILRSTATDVTFLKLGVLKKLTYPTGGVTELEFEQHNYSKKVDENGRWNALIAENNITGGLRIKKISNYDPVNPNSRVEKQYFYIKDFNPITGITTGTSSGILGTVAKYFIPSYSLQTADNSQTLTESDIFSSQSVLPTSENSMGSHIGYTEVIEKTTSNNDSNGWNIYKFTNFESVSLSNGSIEPAHKDDIYEFSLQTVKTPYEPYNSRALERGKLLSSEVFTTTGQPISKRFNLYQALNQDHARVVKATFYSPCNNFIFVYEGVAYKIYTYKFRLKSEEFLTYSQTLPSEFLAQTTDYDYNSIGQIATIKKNESDGTFLVNKRKYVSDYSDPTNAFCLSLKQDCYNACAANSSTLEDLQICQAQCNNDYNLCVNVTTDNQTFSLVAFNSQHYYPLVEQQNFRKIGNIDRAIGGTLNLFRSFGSSEGTQLSEIRNLYVEVPIAGLSFSYIDSTRKFKFNYRYKEADVIFEAYYDFRIYQVNRKNTRTCYFWGYNQLLPVAEVVNSTCQNANQVVSIFSLNGNLTDAQVRSVVNPLRAIPNTKVTTYTYDRVFGLTSITDPSAVTSFYEFDILGRLKLIKDKNGSILKQYRYEYKQ